MLRINFILIMLFAVQFFKNYVLCVMLSRITGGLLDSEVYASSHSLEDPELKVSLDRP